MQLTLLALLVPWVVAITAVTIAWRGNQAWKKKQAAEKERRRVIPRVSTSACPGAYNLSCTCTGNCGFSQPQPFMFYGKPACDCLSCIIAMSGGFSAGSGGGGSAGSSFASGGNGVYMGNVSGGGGAGGGSAGSSFASGGNGVYIWVTSAEEEEERAAARESAVPDLASAATEKA